MASYSVASNTTGTSSKAMRRLGELAQSTLNCSIAGELSVHLFRRQHKAAGIGTLLIHCFLRCPGQGAPDYASAPEHASVASISSKGSRHPYVFSLLAWLSLISFASSPNSNFDPAWRGLFVALEDFVRVAVDAPAVADDDALRPPREVLARRLSNLVLFLERRSSASRPTSVRAGKGRRRKGGLPVIHVGCVSIADRNRVQRGIGG